MRTRTCLGGRGRRSITGLGTRSLGLLDGHRVIGTPLAPGGGFGTVLESFPDDRLTIVRIDPYVIGAAQRLGDAGCAGPPLPAAGESVERPPAVEGKNKQRFPAFSTRHEGRAEQFNRLMASFNFHGRPALREAAWPLRRQAESGLRHSTRNTKFHYVVTCGRLRFGAASTDRQVLMLDAKRRGR
jgi:hypothetical protein